jgi:hypothetical protein
MAKSPTNPNAGTSSIVVLQTRGTSLRALHAKVESGQVSVRDTQTLSATDSAGLTALLRRLKPARIVHLIPPEQTIWRTLDTPAPPVATPPSELRQAMDLMSEGALPSSLEAHRRGAGAISTRSGAVMLACGWPASAALPEIDAALGLDESCVPEVLALWSCAKLLSREPGVLLSADRLSGTITLIGAPSDKPGLMVRVVREDGQSQETWSGAVTQSIEELCAACKLEVPALPSLRDERTLVWPGLSGSPVRVPGALTDDPRWLQEWGALVGAARLALTPLPLEFGLLGMSADEPQTHEPLADRAIATLATPGKVLLVTTACLVLIAGSLFAAPWARLAILKNKAAGATQASSEFQRASDQSDWYQVLREKRWPMTALLGELTASAPEGVMIDDVSIEPGQPVRLSGTAPSAEAVSDWREALNKNPSFKDAKVPAVESAAFPVKFRLELNVAAPLLAAGEIKDLPQRTLGPSTATAAAPTPPSDPKPAASAPAPSRTEPARPTNTRTTRSSRNNTSTPAPASSENTAATPSKPFEVPPALSDEQIAALDKGVLMTEWAKRLGASKRQGLDEETKQRLANEAEKIDARRKQEAGQ